MNRDPNSPETNPAESESAREIAADEVAEASEAGMGNVVPGSVSKQAFGFSLHSWRHASKEGIWVIAGQVMTAVAGLVGLRILTELASRELMGVATMLLGIYAFGRNLFLAPVTCAQIRFHPEYQNQGQAKWFTEKVAFFSRKGTVQLAIACCAALVVWRLAGGNVSIGPIMAIAVTLSVGDTLKSIRLNRLNSERIRANPAIWLSTEAWLMVLCSAAALMLHKSPESYLAGQVLGLLICLGIFGYLFYPPMPADSGTPPAESDQELWNKLYRYGAPFVPLAVVSWIANLGDRYLINGFMGEADVGVYAVAYGLASRPFLMVGGVLNGFARPILFQAESSGNRAKANRIFVYWMAIAVVISGLGVLGFLLIGDWVARLFLSSEFRQPVTVPIFIWVGIGYSLFTVVQIVENRLMSQSASRNLIAPAVAGAVSNILLNLLLIPKFGVVGAAQATAATFLIQLLVICWNFRRRSGMI